LNRKLTAGVGAVGPINDKWRSLPDVVLKQREEDVPSCHVSSAFYEQNYSDPRGGSCEINFALLDGRCIDA
jgi:hypothetical protein